MQKNRITQSIIVGLATLMAAASWSGLKIVLLGSGHWIWPSLGFLVLLIFLSLNWLLAKSKEVLLTTIVFILISFFFSFGFKLEYLAALLIALFFFVFGSFRAISEKEMRIKIQPRRILRRSLPSILTGLSLVIATAYYFSPLALENQNQIKIPRPLFNIIVQPMSETIKEQLPNSNNDEQFVFLKDSQAFQDDLYQAVNQEINKFGQAYQQYFPLGLAISIFLALRTVAILFMWLAILSTWLIFRALVSLKAVKIQEKAVLKQVIEI